MRAVAAVLILAMWPLHFLAASDGSDATSIGTLIVQLGLSGVFLWQWNSERHERQEANARWSEFADKALPVLADCTHTLAKVQEGFSTSVDRTLNSPRDLDIVARRSELVTDQLVAVTQVLSGTLEEMRRSRDAKHGQ